MGRLSIERGVHAVISILLIVLVSIAGHRGAQTVGSASIRGQVADETGAGIPGMRLF